MENLEIGRPSTYATFVDTIVQRNYVKKMDIEGEKYAIKTLILTNKEIIFETTEKIIGQEKNKLVIQPIGTLIMEFLLQHFEELFSYVYTKHMEEKLDIIVNDSNNWTEICKECEENLFTVVCNTSNGSTGKFHIEMRNSKGRSGYDFGPIF